MNSQDSLQLVCMCVFIVKGILIFHQPLKHGTVSHVSHILLLEETR